VGGEGKARFQASPQKAVKAVESLRGSLRVGKFYRYFFYGMTRMILVNQI